MNAERMNMANATAKIEGFYLLAVPTNGKRSAVQAGAAGGKHPEGKDGLQDSCHNGSPATGSASVFYSVLKG